MKNKTLLISATHGNEAFSIPIVKRLKGKFAFDWIIGNPKALRLGTRFFEADLNRSGPGDSKSKLYEERRAEYVIKKASQYDQVIDIHGTVSNCGIFVILSDPNWRNVELAKRLPIKRVVLWPSLQPKGPLTQFIPNSLEIECGPKDSPQVAKDLNILLQQFLMGTKNNLEQEFYIVTGSLSQPVSQEMVDFVETTYQNKTFIPLLVDQYQGIKCYCLQKLESPLDFNTINKSA